MNAKPTAKLKPTIRERGYGKDVYMMVPAYTVITPDGAELQPPMLARSNKYEQSARQFCKAQGWDIEILER